MFSPSLVTGWSGLGADYSDGSSNLPQDASSQAAVFARAINGLSNPAAGMTQADFAWLTWYQTTSAGAAAVNANPQVKLSYQKFQAYVSKYNQVSQMTPAQFAAYQASSPTIPGAASVGGSSGGIFGSLLGKLGVTSQTPVLGSLINPVSGAQFISPTSTTSSSILLYGGVGLLGYALYKKYGKGGRSKNPVTACVNAVTRPIKNFLR